ncbi:MAG: SDR family NAD(P)-dependent oxidoreductase [Gammaproteobacteria bacterium]|nr:SDR family NAD(P)-dependent oxidoreductase [Gammaproteobacteria bacterium]
MIDQRIALVTGGNRGIGLEIAMQLAERGLAVLIGTRQGHPDIETDDAMLERGVGEMIRHVPLDVTDQASIDALPAFFEEEFGQLDVLVNNAGISIDGWTPISEMTDAVLEETLQTNLFGVHRVTRALLPLLRLSPSARIVGVSSTLGSITDISDPDSPYGQVICPAYRISKAALNAWTATLARELSGTAVKVNAACPGWVRTRLGGDQAPRSVAEGADTPVWLATLPDGGPSGGFFRDRKRIAW